MKLAVILAVLVISLSVTAQSFLDAIGPYSQLSSFRQLLLQNATLAADLFGNATTDGINGRNMTEQTILIPSNDAFSSFPLSKARSISSLSSSDLSDLLKYHTQQGALSSTDLQKPGGLLSNTALQDSQYDNRGLGSNGAQLPQVVFIGSTSSNGRVIARQVVCANGTREFVGSGLGAKVNIEFVNGHFDGGMFHIVDGYVSQSVYT